MLFFVGINLGSLLPPAQRESDTRVENGQVCVRQQPISRTAAPIHYIIHMSPNAIADEIQAVRSTLIKNATPNSLSEITSDRTGLILFFKAEIRPCQADAIVKEHGVSRVFVDETFEVEQSPSFASPSSAYLRRRGAGSPKTSIVNQANFKLQSSAVPELKVISQPPGASLAELPGYAFANEGGRGVTIYVLDTGVDVRNPEWYRIPGKKYFLYAEDADKTETDFQNHGSCVASKAGGPVYGTAKNANIVAVKLANHMTIYGMFSALIEISNDVYEKKLEGKAIINISNQAWLGDLHQSTRVAYELLIDALLKEDIVIVTASGNDREDRNDVVTGYPAVLGPTTDVIVVGAVTDRGHRTYFSQGAGNALTVSAPGYVHCADASMFGGDRETYGTSFAAPAVSGVIAVWLSQPEYKARLQVTGKVAANVKRMVRQVAYSRAKGEPAVIWNGIDPR
ncbi:subtilisin-like protein [Colletotrichum falcatum]|nr:subtilisin-like protein [Colletotrichum falcatum]